MNFNRTARQVLTIRCPTKRCAGNHLRARPSAFLFAAFSVAKSSAKVWEIKKELTTRNAKNANQNRVNRKLLAAPTESPRNFLCALRAPCG